MGFKVLVKEAQPPERSDYLKNKIDIAAAHDVVYDAEGEDLRIDELYRNPDLYHEKSLIAVDRVLVGKKEQLVGIVDVVFKNNKTDVQADRYIDYEGRNVIPVKFVDPKTGVLNVEKNGRYEYTLEFSPSNVDSLIAKYPNSENIDFRFYSASTAIAKPVRPVIVRRKEFFKNATWEELVIGKEKRYTDSTVNKLSALRKEVDYEERQQYETGVAPIQPMLAESEKNRSKKLNNLDSPPPGSLNTKDEDIFIADQVVVNNSEPVKPNISKKSPATTNK